MSASFFTRTFLATYLDKAFSDLRSVSLADGGREQLMFSTPVGEIATREAVTAARDTSIMDAARIMSRRRVSSLMITERGGSPSES